MAYTNINKSKEHFNTVTYAGDGNSPRSITGVGFQPDFTWIKNRTNDTKSHVLANVIQGYGTNGTTLKSDSTDAQGNSASTGRLRDPGATTDGFTVGDSSFTNESSTNIVAWNWKANGTGSSNTDGSITSTVSANTTSGFSIVSWTGTGANGTIGHGLNSTPQVVIVKDRSAGFGWLFGHNSLGSWTKNLKLNETIAVETITSTFNSTAPTSSVFSIGSSGANNGSGNSLIAYCFAQKTGYSKFGSYTGNGSTDGAFVYTGFKPAFVMLKPTSTTGNWFILDNKRSSFNVMDKYIRANESSAEATFSMVDFVSNGVKIITSDSSINGSGVSYIYMAFAEAPLVGTNNVPCTAR